MAAEEEVIDLEPYEEESSVDEARPLHSVIRAVLVVLTVPWIVVFCVAIWINPYKDKDGNDADVQMAGTHQQLGLPECNFKTIAGVPCPSCGMTTSFSLLLHADVWNSLQANFAGTALAAFGLLFIPWAFASAFLGRLVFVRRLEMVIFRLALIFLVVLFGRWSIVLILDLFFST